MTQEITPSQAQQAAEASAQAIDAVQSTISQFLSAADVQAVYGEPLQQGNSTIIPCAEVLSIAGFGMGSGFGSSPNTDAEGKPAPAGAGASAGAGTGGGGGGGGGGKVLSRPVVVIVASSSGVEVKPVVDVTKIALAGITAWGFMIATMFRMRRNKPE